jgi:hypothetical protein
LSVLTINEHKMSDLDDRERPVIIDDRERDRDVIINNLMDELCKRQHNFERNGGDEWWSFDDVWQSKLSAFQRGEYTNEIEQYRNESGYFDIDANDRIALTERGKGHCRAAQ